jgi:phospholipid/cholesterol/gamma-HCH transport system substrate-binding protein
VDEKILGNDTTKQVQDAVASFKNAAASLESSMKKLDPAIAKVDGVVTRADAVMVSADSAMKSIDASSTALGKVATDIRKGNGLLPALIYDDGLKTEFKLLITNLRQRGILFYKDKAEEAPAGNTRPPMRGRGN